MEQLYEKYKNKFKKDKQKQIESDIQTLKTIKNRTFNDKILKEMLKKLNLLSYNYQQIVLNTWNNGNITGKKQEPKTFEEDLETTDSDDDLKEIDEIFISNDEGSESETDFPKLEFTKKKKPKNFNV